MHWRMFEPTAEKPRCLRLHLLIDKDDTPYAGIASSHGFVEQDVAKGQWTHRPLGLKFTVFVNATEQEIDVPDLETGMAVLMMNVKGNQSG